MRFPACEHGCISAVHYMLARRAWDHGCICAASLGNMCVQTFCRGLQLLVLRWPRLPQEVSTQRCRPEEAKEVRAQLGPPCEQVLLQMSVPMGGEVRASLLVCARLAARRGAISAKFLVIHMSWGNLHKMATPRYDVFFARIIVNNSQPAKDHNVAIPRYVVFFWQIHCK